MHHFVEFYGHDGPLLDSLRTYFAIGISRGDAAILIAERPHKQALEQALGRIIDLRSASAGGLYRSFDAEELLSLIVEDGLPSPSQFDAVIGELVRSAVGKGAPLRVFGELVSLLWMNGNAPGALSLEDLWNDLVQRHRFRLFCAYPARYLSEDDFDGIASICSRHTHVVVSGSEAV